MFKQTRRKLKKSMLDHRLALSFVILFGLVGSIIVFSSSATNAPPTDSTVSPAVALSWPNSGTPFAANSFWNTQVPANAPLNANSSSYVADITNQACYGTGTSTGNCNPDANPQHTTLNSSQWSAPLYVVPIDQPTSTVTNDCGGPNFTNVPLPADAHGSGETVTGSGDTDKEIQIYQPSTDKEWEFWQFDKNAGGNWEACAGTHINNVSTSSGATGAGITAAGLPLLGGVVRIEELQAGEIDHVMNLSIFEPLDPTVISGLPSGVAAGKGFSWPAARSDGTDADPLAIPEGLRFRLNPNLDLSRLALSPVAMTIAVAAQKYGFVVDDRAGSVNIRTGDPTTYTVAGLPNPYSTGTGVGGTGTQGLFGGATSGNVVMQNFPWSQLQALPFNYGQPDTTPPAVSLGGPADGSTVSGNVTISATATDNIGVASVQFVLDGNNLGAADTASPYSYSWDSTSVANGTHTLKAIAKDAAGNTTTSTSINVTVNNSTPTLPDTTIISGPSSSTTATTATFNFSGTDNTTPGGSLTFQCQLDNGGYSSCSSPKAYSGLGIGSHTFQVRAIDEDNNIDASPASQTWTVTAIVPAITGDLDGDGHVTGHDLSILLSHFGTDYPPAEFDNANVVEGHDLSILLSNYGK